MIETTGIVQNAQSAPYPYALDGQIEQLNYREGWSVQLVRDLDRGQACCGLTLVIVLSTPDSYADDQTIRVAHYFPVPPAAYDERSWRRWLFDRIGDVELHERMEFFRLVHRDPGGYVLRDGSTVTEYVERPYAPSHGPGNDPYMVREIGTRTDQRTSFRGEIER